MTRARRMPGRGRREIVADGFRLAAIAAILLFLPGAHANAGELAINETGIASVYSGAEGNRTASGEKLILYSLSAAHRTLPFGTRVRVTHGGNKRTVVVRIVDRGPFIKGRVIDLTPAAALALGFSGLARVTLSGIPKTAMVPETMRVSVP